MAWYNPLDRIAKTKEYLFGEDPEAPQQIETSRLTPGQQQLSSQLGQYFSGQLGERGFGTSPLQTLSLQGLEQFLTQAAGGGPTTTMQQTTTPEAQATINELMAGQGQQGFEQFFQSAVQDPLTEQFQEEVLPQISRSFAASGLFGGERQKAEATATESLTEALAGERSKLASQFAQQDIQNRLAAAGLAPKGTETRDMGTLLSGLLGAGQLGQQQQQQQLANMLAFLGTPTKDTTIVQDQGTPGLLGPVLQGLASAIPFLL